MLKRAAMIVIPLLVVCGMIEMVLRTTHLFNARISWTEPDREIAWRFTPGREYWFFGENDHAITGRINSMGWRDRERSVARPAGVYRIAVLGDSFVEAFQVEQDSTFEAIAERRWGSRTEVMNFGRSGMSQAEESIVLEHDVLRCHPDAVVLLFTPSNDIADINPETTTDPGRPFYRRVAGDSLALDTSFANRRGFHVRGLINPFKQHSALISLVIERYNVLRTTRAQGRVTAPTSNGLTHEQRLCSAHPDSVFMMNYALCKTLIARMAHRCARDHARFILASVPFVYQEVNIRSARAVDPSFDPLFFDHDLAALADSSGFKFVPLTQIFTDRSREAGPLNWAHWNYAGHRTVAGVLSDSGVRP